jgi:hypothetical protein
MTEPSQAALFFVEKNVSKKLKNFLKSQEGDATIMKLASIAQSAERAAVNR